MKNIVECYKHFFGYFNALETHSEQNAPEFVCPSPNVLDFNEKVLHWASVARGVKLPIFAWDINVKSCDMYQICITKTNRLFYTGEN